MIYSDFGRDVPTKVTIPDSCVSSCGTSWGTPSEEASLPKIFYDYTERTSLHGIHSSMKKDYSLPRKYVVERNEFIMYVLHMNMCKSNLAL